MSQKYPAEQVRAFADALVRTLAPACQRIEVAGSLRRQAAEVKDIELVAVAKPWQPEFGWHGPVPDDALTDRLLAMSEAGEITADLADRSRWGPRYKSFVLLDGGGERLPFVVDLFVVKPPAQWGPIFVIRTGPGSESNNFNRELMVWIKRCGLAQVNGHLERLSDGKVLDTPDEESYFAVLGLPWIPPEQRSVDRLRALLGQRTRR